MSCPALHCTAQHCTDIIHLLLVISYCLNSAALDMGGKAIPGQHWVEVDLGRQCVVEKAVIDWEDGYSNTWTLKVNSQYLEQNVHLI